MGFKITAKDLIIEVDTQEEFRAAWDVIHASEGKHERRQKSESRKKIQPSLLAEKPPFPDKHSVLGLSKEEKLSSLYEYVRNEPRGNMLKFIEALADSSDFLAPKAIAETSGIDFDGIGGTVGSLSKITRRFGLIRDDILLREHSPKTGSRFQLTPAMREVVLAEPEKEQAM